MPTERILTIERIVEVVEQRVLRRLKVNGDCVECLGWNSAGRPAIGIRLNGEVVTMMVRRLMFSYYYRRYSMRQIKMKCGNAKCVKQDHMIECKEELPKCSRIEFNKKLNEALRRVALTNDTITKIAADCGIHRKTLEKALK